MRGDGDGGRWGLRRLLVVVLALGLTTAPGSGGMAVAEGQGLSSTGVKQKTNKPRKPAPQRQSSVSLEKEIDQVRREERTRLSTVDQMLNETIRSLKQDDAALKEGLALEERGQATWTKLAKLMEEHRRAQKAKIAKMPETVIKTVGLTEGEKWMLQNRHRSDVRWEMLFIRDWEARKKRRAQVANQAKNDAIRYLDELGREKARYERYLRESQNKAQIIRQQLKVLRDLRKSFEKQRAEIQVLNRQLQ